MSKPTFIAEVKTQSPFGFKSNRTWFELFNIADQYGDIISVHTNPLWGGSFDLLYLAKQKTKKPILAKGLHLSNDEIKKAIDYGADYILCYDGGCDPQNWNKLFIEPKNIKSLDYMIRNNSIPFAKPSFPKILWNQRNLFTGKQSETSFDEVRNKYPDYYLCQASFIKKIEDVHPKANAFIVGQYLETFVGTL